MSSRESSVTASIEEILRDARCREEEAGARRRAQASERLRAEIAEHRRAEVARRRAEEQHRLAVQRAAFEAEAPFRAARAAALQEHELRLHEMRNDARGLEWRLRALAGFAIAGAVVSAVTIAHLEREDARLRGELERAKAGWVDR